MFRKFISNRRIAFLLLTSKFSTSNCFYENHYETLKLSKNCTTADIRNSYIKLSKEYHPDRNVSNNTHKKFVKISEAYNILKNPISRQNYDLGLSNPARNDPKVHVRRNAPEPPSPSGTWSDETFWEYRDKSKDEFYKSRPYYGIKGIKKLSNIWIVVLCIAFTTFGVILQIIAIRASFTLRRDELEKRSQELEALHASIREQALKNGNKKQMELLIEKLNSRHNPRDK